MMTWSGSKPSTALRERALESPPSSIQVLQTPGRCWRRAGRGCHLADAPGGFITSIEVLDFVAGSSQELREFKCVNDAAAGGRPVEQETDDRDPDGILTLTGRAASHCRSLRSRRRVLGTDAISSRGRARLRRGGSHSASNSKAAFKPWMPYRRRRRRRPGPARSLRTNAFCQGSVVFSSSCALIKGTRLVRGRLARREVLPAGRNSAEGDAASPFCGAGSCGTDLFFRFRSGRDILRSPRLQVAAFSSL